MVDRATKLRWRRRLRKQRKQIEEIGTNAEHGLDIYFFRRLGRLSSVWRFTAGWITLLILLSVGTVLQIKAQNKYFQAYRPASGGTFTEGIIGTFTNANPLYATSAVDSSISRLMFSGLLKFDRDNKLVPDLAESINVDASGKIFTVTLRPNLKWHDGIPLTSKDVVFTYQTIRNPDARSPYFNTWKEVKVTRKDSRTITFELPNVLGSFEEMLTNGIVPEHLLKDIEPSELRTSKFNTVHPVGSGPFKWDALEVLGITQESRQEVIGLDPYDSYHLGKPKVNHFTLHTYRDENQMVQAYKAGELTSMVGLANVRDDIREVADFNEYNVPIMGEVMVFFKTTFAPLDDVRVRRALVQSVDTSQAVAGLGYRVRLIHGPLLETHIGYNKQFVQLPNNIAEARKALDEAGWKLGSDGTRQKEGKELTFTLLAQNSSDYSAITGYLQKAWKSIGVKVDVMLQGETDVQGAVSRHDYDSLLYGISVGNDPDVFAYWHSSQASPNSPNRLNFSEYNSKDADASLEAGRARLDPKVRSTKYDPFLKAWREDAPALALYQPAFLYVTRGRIYNFEPNNLNIITNRFANVENWMIRQEKGYK